MNVFMERARLVLDRRLSLANLLQRLARLYGPHTALALQRPFMPSLAPREHISFREALRLTDLAAEALVRVLDLHKGERVLVLAPDAGESLLLVISLVKAGGIAVPLPRLPEDEELEAILREGGIGKALVSGGFFRGREAGRLDLLRRRGGFQLMPIGREDAEPGVVSLEEASAEASGFFIPYTLKPGSVVMLSMRSTARRRPLLVMATNRALLHPTRMLCCLLPVGKGERCLFLTPPEGPSFLAAAVLVLSAGLCLYSQPEEHPPSIHGGWEGAPPVLVTNLRPTAWPVEVKGATSFPTTVRLLIRSGEPNAAATDRSRSPGADLSSHGGWRLLLEFDSLDETAPLALFRLSLAIGENLLRTPFLPLPPHRVRRNGESPAEARGVTAVRGPTVTPGWWNDLEASLRAWRKGWFHPHAAS